MSRVPHMGDNSTYPMACHYIIGDTCGIYAASNEKKKKKKNLNLKTFFKKKIF
jgi:hypothetical protein